MPRCKALYKPISQSFLYSALMSILTCCDVYFERDLRETSHVLSRSGASLKSLAEMCLHAASAG
jgi:hypothetical protein